MTAKQRTSKPSDEPDLTDSMYCEHKRTRAYCEDCHAEGKLPNARPDLNARSAPTVA